MSANANVCVCVCVYTTNQESPTSGMLLHPCVVHSFLFPKTFYSCTPIQDMTGILDHCLDELGLFKYKEIK